MELEIVANVNKIHLKSKWEMDEVEIEYENIPITSDVCKKEGHNE